MPSQSPSNSANSPQSARHGERPEASPTTVRRGCAPVVRACRHSRLRLRAQSRVLRPRDRGACEDRGPPGRAGSSRAGPRPSARRARPAPPPRSCRPRPNVGAGVALGSSSLPCSEPGSTLVAGHRIKPWPEPLAVAQPLELLSSDEERVLERIRRVVWRMEHREAEVVDPIGVALVDLAERGLVAREVSPHQLGIRGSRTRRRGVGRTRHAHRE